MAPSAKSTARHADRIILMVLAAVGLLISAYLTWVHYAGITPICVGVKGGCETVQARLPGRRRSLRRSSLGLIGYAFPLISAAWRSEIGVYLGFLISLVGTLFSAYLTYLEFFVIHALCQWCLASAAIMLASLVSASFGAWRLTKN